MDAGDRGWVRTSRRPSPADARAPQRPPWATAHRPVRSRRRPAATGKERHEFILKLVNIFNSSQQNIPSHRWTSKQSNRRRWRHCVWCATMAIHGFQKVKASIMWAASVAITAHKTQITFLPVLSTRNPKIGDAGAEMIYTILGKTGERFSVLLKQNTPKHGNMICKRN